MQWKNELEQVYNRGFWDCYYLGRKLGEWSPVYGSAAKKEKMFVGKVIHYYPKAKVAHIQMKAREISEEDTLLLIGDRTGVVEQQIQTLWVDDKPSQKAVKGEECTIKMDQPVRDGDNVYLWKDRA